jgi:2-polyprenyl-3-methyl-5-hydroxy-6-metoxy-1,4-benzoquinol methylase
MVLAADPAVSVPAIRTEPRPYCVVCNNRGIERYRDIPDLLLGLAGRWRVVRCTNASCGTHWLDPAPVTADLGLAYQDYVTHDEGVPVGMHRRAWRQRAVAAIQHAELGYPVAADRVGSVLGRLLALSPRHRAMSLREVLYVPYKKEGRLLEVGCGNGRFLDRLRRAGWNCVGVDFDQEAARTARRLGLDVRVGDLAAQDFADASFDALVMSHVIEHVPDPRAVLAECRRVLRPGGRIVLLTPNVRSLGHRVAGRHWIGLDPPRHLFVYTAAALGRLLDGAGFTAIETRTPSEMAAGFIAADELRRDAERLGRATPLPQRGARFSLRTLALAGAEMVLCSAGAGLGEEILARAVRP